MQNMRSASSTGAPSGDTHPTALELPEWVQNWQAEYGCNQKDFSQILYRVPNRTLQSWLLGEKEPPKYVQKLIMYKLKETPQR